METNVGHHGASYHVEKVVVDHDWDWDKTIVPVTVFLVDQVVPTNLILSLTLKAIKQPGLLAIRPILLIVYLEPILLILVITKAAESAIDIALPPIVRVKVLPSLVGLSLVLLVAVGGVERCAVELLVVVQELEWLLHAELKLVSDDDDQRHEGKGEEKADAATEEWEAKVLPVVDGWFFGLGELDLGAEYFGYSVLLDVADIPFVFKSDEGSNYSCVVGGFFF